MSLKYGTNYHSHCQYCDGRAPMEEFVKAAIEAGFSSYGISSHAPLPAYVGFSKVLQWECVDAYLAEIASLKRKYQSQIEVYASMEIDYIDEDHNPANDYFQSLDLDYSIGSVHFIKVGPQEVFDADTRPESFIKSLLLYYDNDLRRLVCDYFDAKMRMVALGGFDFVGHADKISMNASRVEPGITQKVWYKRKVQEYFSFIAQRGMMLELNTKAYDSSGYLFPNAQNLRMLCQMGIPLVVNSDSHRPELINSGRMASIELLREVGYKAIMEFHNNQWHEQEI